MRGHRWLFILATCFALGLIGFANFPGDRDAVPDSQAAQLVGGLCDTIYWTVNCTGTCPMVGGLCNSCNGPFRCNNLNSCACGGGTNTVVCGTVFTGCTGG